MDFPHCRIGISTQSIQIQSPMKCYNHKDSEAVAVCVHCGRAICFSCAKTSASGRFVCSLACATASEQTENFILVTRNKSVRGTYMTACFVIGMGLLFAVTAVFLHQELGAIPQTIYVGGSAIGFVIGGLCYLWIAIKKR
jgi:hypothetical protein